MTTLIRALMVLSALVAIGWRAWPRPVPRDELVALRDRIEARLVEQVDAGRLARESGHTYGVDLGNALYYAALRGHAALYDRLRAVAVARFVVQSPDDPETHGMVSWRRHDREPIDASGTTEGLRVAAGLWEGGRRFDRAADRDLALAALHAYGRHATVDQGQWFIRNYFNFGTRTYANDSYLVDYDPDLLRRVAAEAGDAAIAELADKSYALVRAARAPSGLVYSMIQPDVATLVPGFPMPAFAPNDLLQLNATCTVAETVTRGAPEVARGVVEFARARLADLRLYYRARDGAPLRGTRAEVTTLSCLVRAAVGLGDRTAARDFARAALPRWRAFADYPSEPWLYVAGEVLLALQAAIDAGVGE